MEMNESFRQLQAYEGLVLGETKLPMFSSDSVIGHRVTTREDSFTAESSRLGSPCDSCGQEQLRELSLWAADLQDQSEQRPSGIRPDGAGGGPCQSVPQSFVVDFFQSFLHGEFGVFNMMDLGGCILDLGGCIQR